MDENDKRGEPMHPGSVENPLLISPKEVSQI